MQGTGLQILTVFAALKMRTLRHGTLSVNDDERAGAVVSGASANRTSLRRG
jgi:hypothetical protein